MGTHFALIGFRVGLVLFILLGACSRDPSYETKEGKVTVKGEGKKIEVKTEEGMVTMEGSEEEGRMRLSSEEGEDIEITYNRDMLPDSFPDDVPIYEPSQVVAKQKVGVVSTMLTLSTTDGLEQVLAFYRKGLSGEGWKIQEELTMRNTTILRSDKAERTLTVTISGEGEKTVISLVIGKRQQEGGV